MTIPVFNLSRQIKNHSEEFQKSIHRVMSGGVFILGKEVETFEKEFAAYSGLNYGVGVGSGTEALSLSLQALGVKAGDEVILPANAYPTVFAITAIGTIPRPVDVDPDTHCMDPNKLEEALSKTRLRQGSGGVRAAIVVHMYGKPANIETISKITRDKKVPLIEDCAHAHGAKVRFKIKEDESKRIEWRSVGTFGDVACYSFYPTKNLGALGDGGLVATNNPLVADRVRKLRMYGEKARYESVLLGRNSRLDELQAAILRVKLKHLDQWIQRRRAIARMYDQKLKIKRTKLTDDEKDVQSVYHLYVIQTAMRDKLKDYLQNHGIGTGIHYPTPVHLVPSMKFLGYKKGDFPVSEKLSDSVLSLPIYPELTSPEVLKVCTYVNEFIKAKL